MPQKCQYTVSVNQKQKKMNKNIQVESMGLFGAAKADPKKQVNEMSQLLRRLVIKDFTS